MQLVLRTSPCENRPHPSAIIHGVSAEIEHDRMPSLEHLRYPLPQKLPDSPTALQVLLEARSTPEKPSKPLVLTNKDRPAIRAELPRKCGLSRAGSAGKEIECADSRCSSAHFPAPLIDNQKGLARFKRECGQS